jgi:diacylglycerol kinase family enzyme
MDHAAFRHPLTARPSRRREVSQAAVVVNPAKFSDLAAFRERLNSVLSEYGWADARWLETTPDDPGEGQARQAAASGADLVIAVGGDGTVTSCAAGLAGTGVPLAIVPAGTGNLLARNLGLPSEFDEAIVVALGGQDRQIDVGTANGRTFVAMAGLGLDAMMLSSASDAAKRRYGWAAYAYAVLAHLRDRPMRLRVSVDGGPAMRRRAAGLIVGNVGWLRGGIPLLPDAEPDDGRLDVVLLLPRGLAGWLSAALLVLLRRESRQLPRHSFTRLRVDIDREQPWELDGELMGPTRRLEVALHDQKLTLRVPAAPGKQAAGGRPAAAAG